MVELGYFFTVLSYVCYCISRFMKHKKRKDMEKQHLFISKNLYKREKMGAFYLKKHGLFAIIGASIKKGPCYEEILLTFRL